MSVWLWVAVGAIGGLGSVARMAGTLAIGRHKPAVGTLAINIVGAFALGVLSGAGVAGDGRLLAGTALLGSFTTFSTWMHESLALHDGARGRQARALLAVALAGGLAAAALGRALAHWL